MNSPILRHLVALGALALAAVPAAAQGRDDERVTSRIDTTVTLAKDGTVDLSLVSGEIIVSAGTGNSVRVRATSERGILEFSASPTRVSLDVRSQRGRMGDTRYEVTVPVGARLQLKAVSGDITARGVKGAIEAGSVSGDVVISDGATEVTLESVSGDVRGERLSGDVRASAVSGDISLDAVTGTLEVETVSGEMTLERVTAKSVRTESVSGDVIYEGSLDKDGRYEFHSHSGNLNLRVPSGAGGTVRLETFSGSVESDFPMTLQPGEASHGRPKRMQFSFGGGGARISAETFSGDIMIEKAGAAPARP